MIKVNKKVEGEIKIYLNSNLRKQNRKEGAEKRGRKNTKK